MSWYEDFKTGTKDYLTKVIQNNQKLQVIVSMVVRLGG